MWWFLCRRRSSFKGLLRSDILSSYSVHLLKSLLNLRKAYIDLCLLNLPKRSSFRSLLLNLTVDQAFIFFSMVRHSLWKMCVIPGACIKPGLVRLPLCHKVNLLSWVARQPLSGHRVNLPSSASCVPRQPLCHEVNLPRLCEVRQLHLIMTYDIFGTRQTNTLTLCKRL